MIKDVVVGVNFFPFKGAHAATINGEVPTSLPVGVSGFEVNGVLDRDLGLYDPASERIVTQRGYGRNESKAEHPDDSVLATLLIDVQEDHLALSSVAGHLDLPLLPTDGESSVLSVWGRRFPIIKQRNEDIDSYFQRLLGREVWLVRADRNDPGIISERHWREGSFNQISGADNLPLSLLNQASLNALHVRNGMEIGTVPISRYRGGIIAGGMTLDRRAGYRALGPFGEDFIDPQQPFTIGEIKVWAAKAIARCTVTEIDQDTGVRAGKGLRVLRGRVGSIPGEDGVFFGERLTHASLGIISVGDEIVIPSLSSVPNVKLRAAA